ncbi:MAG TPA: response regulator [Opitutaceae bacterium]|nr:response regulator [Opitutaceae bacterium]
MEKPPLNVPPEEKNRRILVIDDNRAIHEDFRKILQPDTSAAALAQDEATLFGDHTSVRQFKIFTVHAALQGPDGLAMVRGALAAGQPYAMAFVDMRMPPGWDGLETTLKLWEIQPDLQVVICTAYSDYAWKDLIAKIGLSDRLVILKKPFDNIEVLQLSLTLTEKWHLLQQARQREEGLRQAIDVRTADLRAEIEERRRAEDEAHAARIAAETANRSKSTFLANMSHEIRTPMNGILGMANLLLDTHLTEEQASFVRTLRDSSESLLAILNDILDFSKIEAGRLTLETVDFDLTEIVEGTTELHAARACEKKLELIAEIDEEVPAWLRGDPLRLRQVLLNLLGNALKFTERGEVYLHVSLERQDEDTARLCFAVRDTGIGIPPEALPRLFQPFCQADESTTRRFGGTGLGLAISRRLIEAMGGTITARSDPGRGSTFQFSLPFAKPNLAAAVRPADGAHLRGVRALVVDDNETNRMVLHHLLARWGVAHEAVATAAAALEALQQAAASPRPYDLILLDMHMPVQDGLTLAGNIRAAALAHPPRLVMLTSMDVRLNGSGHDGHPLDACLTKPLRPSQLLQCLTTLLAGREGAAGPAAAARDSTSRAPFRAPTPAPTNGSRPAIVLVAEDDAVNQKVALAQLKRLGWAADVVADGRSVLPALRRHRYGVIFMDCQMPGLNGFETTRLIRAEEAAGQATWPVPVRIVAMTANAMQGDRESCLAAGMNDYLAKPTGLTELAAVLERQRTGGSARPRPAEKSPALVAV